MNSTLRSLSTACALLVPLLTRAVAGAEAPPGPVFAPSASLDLPGMMQIVARRSAAVQAEILNRELATAEVRQSHLLGNPTFDATWGTVPLGETNPPQLGSPLTSVPSYGFGLSYTFPLGKRDPRQQRAAALEESARATVTATARAQALDLARILGAAAVAALRVEGLGGLVAQERGSIALAQSRLSGGFGTPLDVDRLMIELNRTEQQVLDNEGDMREALTTCASLLGQRCEAFSNTDDARAFLTAWVKRAEGLNAGGSMDARPDVRALDAAGRAAISESDFASAQAIPDPTLRLGYVYDQFVASGNQAHSLNVSLALPLPIFDHGQALRDAAEARRRRFGTQRDRIVTVAKVRMTVLRDLLDMRERRQEIIVMQMLPRARAVVGDLEKAAATRLIPLTDVIQARRTLSELLVQEAETYGDAFQVAVNIVEESPMGSADVDPRSGRAGAPP